MTITDLTAEQSSLQRSDSLVVDVVAIHGLFEGTPETWTDRDSGLLWLRDLFPFQKLRARVLSYNYKVDGLTSPGEGSADRLLPHAITLIAELYAERDLVHAVQRPIVFVCHDLGGILLKRALAYSSARLARSTEHLRSIFVSTYAILFMATPHDGLSKDVILLSNHGVQKGPSQFMISLLKGSEMVNEVTDQFSSLMKDFKIYNFWEQLPTRTENKSVYIVDQDSAIPKWDNNDRCGILADHSSMVKFKSQKSPGCRVVLAALKRYIECAPNEIKSRWESEIERRRAERQMEVRAMLPPQLNLPVPDRQSKDDLNELFVVPRGSINYFTGRQKIAQLVREKLEPVQRHQVWHKPRVFVIYGLGGSGKTQFCLKYVEDNRQRYWGVFWIDASSQENAESGFAALGQQAGKGASFAAGYHWLSTCSKPWLLVIDNADDPDMDVSQFFPPGGNGHILVTTRNPGARDHATEGSVRFQGMDPEEAIALLLKSAYPNGEAHSTNPQRRSIAQCIADELGYLALALAQAGATIRRNIYTLEKYLYYYLGHRKKMISYPGLRHADDTNIITTWEIPFQRIVRRQSVEHRDAVDLVHLFAFMHFESISEKIFQRSWNGIEMTQSGPWTYPGILQPDRLWNEEAQARLRRALGVLCDYSIIDHDPDKGSCSIHPVIHSWARDRLTVSDQKLWLGHTMAVLAHCISSNLEASGRSFRKLLLPHIDSCMRTLEQLSPSIADTVQQAAEVEKFAHVYAENGLWKQARKLQIKVIDFRKRTFGKGHEETIRAQRSLGHTYWNLFEIKPAIQVQLQVLQSRWFSRPSWTGWITWPWLPDHVSYCVTLDDITLLLWLAGERQKSKWTGERAVKGLMKRLGPDDPQTLNAMFNLARTYLHLGNPQQSLRLLVTVLQKRKRFFGMDHPDTLMTRNEIGMNLCAQKRRLAVAEKLVSNVLRSRKRILGEEHAYTLWSVNDLSKVLCERGRAAEAAAMLEDIIPIVLRTLGEEHVGMFMTKSNLARAYVRSERWREAEALLYSLLPLIPQTHPDWIHTMSGYVHVLIHLGKVDEAENNCVRMLDSITRGKILSLEDPRTVAIARQLSEIYHKQGRMDRLVKLERRIPGLQKFKPGTEFSVLPLREEAAG